MYFSTIDYVHTLIANANRKKAKAFWEYCYDMEFGQQNTDYASSWDVPETTATKWVGEFYTAIQDEIKNTRRNIDDHAEALNE